MRWKGRLTPVLDLDGQAALQRFFQGGGVYTGVHAASACLFNDTNYLQAVGGELSSPPWDPS